MSESYVDKVLLSNVTEVLKKLPDNHADAIVTSTPYWGLRDYGEQNIVVWNGKEDCKHDWQNTELSLNQQNRNFHYGTQEEVHDENKTGLVFIPKFDKIIGGVCVKCGAWKGQLGLEPHPQMFIEHLVQIFREARRVLKLSGSCWVVMGDTYFGGNGKAGRPENWQDMEKNRLDAHAPESLIKERNKLHSNWLQPKQKMLIPERFAIAMQEDGWILRNTVIWNKLNHMPSSVQDRLSNAYESVFFFVKNQKYYFDLDAIRRTSIWASRDKRSLLGRVEGKLGYNPMGANPADVWSLTTEGLKEEHYAAFPQKLVKRILECSVPKEICGQCIKPRISCKCIDSDWKNVKYHSGLVLDPFCGSGTTLIVAQKLGLHYLGIDLNPKYTAITEERLKHTSNPIADKKQFERYFK